MGKVTAFQAWRMTRPFRHCFFSPGATKAATLPSHLMSSLKDLPDVLSIEANQDLVVALASELVRDGPSMLPHWVGVDSKYLVVMDLPEPAALRLPSLLAIRKPDQRMPASLRRWTGTWRCPASSASTGTAASRG